ncbi:hypothetical protein TYRP_022231, partial [Tyrophagus putrescentiae]
KITAASASKSRHPFKSIFCQIETSPVRQVARKRLMQLNPGKADAKEDFEEDSEQQQQQEQLKKDFLAFLQCKSSSGAQQIQSASDTTKQNIEHQNIALVSVGPSKVEEETFQFFPSTAEVFRREKTAAKVEHHQQKETT